MSSQGATLAAPGLRRHVVGRVARRAGASSWPVPIWGALGLTLIAGSFLLSREGHSAFPVTILFWAGFTTMVAPIAVRLLAEDTSRSDRVALVVLMGLLAYGVKVLRDPLMFVMSDEFTHLAAAQQVIHSHKLFGAVPVSGLTAASEYPGLETVTTTISQVTGLTLFASGLIVIGVARTIIMLALFDLYERVTGSARIAGLGALMFAANGNFLYWSAQFSYESLALPLFVLALALYVRRTERGSPRVALTVTLVLLTATITATHHLTSYALALSLWILTLLSLRESSRRGRATGLALFATAASSAWFFLVATGTRAYLGYVAGRTFDAVKDAAQGTHAPFGASAAPLQTPVIEQLVSFAGVLLVIAAVLSTLRRARETKCLHRPIGIFLGACGLGFLALYPLRLFPGAWETANRGQEFLFIGAAMLIALTLARLSRADAGRGRRRLLVLVILVVICGGVISGWPTPLLLARPVQVRQGTAVIVPQSLGVAGWAIKNLPRHSTYMADEATGRELLVGGAGFTFLGAGDNVPALLHMPELPTWQREVLIKEHVGFVAVDRRQVSSNNQAAYFFQTAHDPSGGYGYYAPGVQSKFEVPSVSRVLDSGDIVVFDVRGLWQQPRECSSLGPLSEAPGVSCREPGAVLTLAESDGVVVLSSLRARYLQSEFEERVSGLYVTVLLQVENVGHATETPDPTGRSFYLRIGEQRVNRQPLDRERADNFDGAIPLAPGASREGSLRFVVENPTLIHTLLTQGAQLRILSPTPARGGVRDVGVVTIPPPSKGDVR